MRSELREALKRSDIVSGYSYGFHSDYQIDLGVLM
jgi:hypothetical protein